MAIDFNLDYRIRSTDTYGTRKGSSLTAAEVDANFHEVASKSAAKVDIVSGFPTNTTSYYRVRNEGNGDLFNFDIPNLYDILKESDSSSLNLGATFANFDMAEGSITLSELDGGYDALFGGRQMLASEISSMDNGTLYGDDAYVIGSGFGKFESASSGFSSQYGDKEIRGGDVKIYGGRSVKGYNAGNPSSGYGGDVQIYSGHSTGYKNSTSFYSGNIDIQALSGSLLASSINGNDYSQDRIAFGGDISIGAGNSLNGVGGSVQISAGNTSPHPFTPFDQQYPFQYVTPTSVDIDCGRGWGANAGSEFNVFVSVPNSPSEWDSQHVLELGLKVSHEGVYTSFDFNSLSDRRVKENIVTVDGALQKVSDLRGVYYNRIGDPDQVRKLGVIAQEVEEVIPEVIYENGDHKTVAYGNIVGLLIEAIKELKAEVDELKAINNV